MTEKIIGHGTWYDKTAARIIEREQKLNRNIDLIRTEMGLGASGLPHIGSFGDAARSFAITLALREQDFNSELIAFSDDKDGLRKVPAGFPKRMRKYLGYPVTDIPDPSKCHNSFGDHMSSLLLEALDKCKIEYNFISAKKAYEEGWFNEEIKTILTNAKRVGEIVEEEVGQKKYTEALPYFPICSDCGRIYTTFAHEFLPKKGKILYTCKGMEIKGKWLEGCGNEGKIDYRKGDGKLSWKSEFAVRWKALDIRFEAYGKDIEDSVRINDRICQEILHYEPPLHARYEMFLDKSGRKISKSAGNVFTPQVWFRYGSPQSLILLMLKRFTGTRELSERDIPQYMNEFDELEDIYFGKKQIVNKKEFAKLTGLYKYCWWLKTPTQPSVHVPYKLLAYISRVAPKDLEEQYIAEKLIEYGHLKEKDQLTLSLQERVQYAINWNKDFAEIKEITIELSEKEKEAIKAFIQILQTTVDPDEIQSAVFSVARQYGVQLNQFFETLYTILLGTTKGGRLGNLIVAIKIQKAVDALKKAIEN